MSISLLCFLRASIRCSNPECGVDYSLEVIEQHLIFMLMRRSMTYTLQDLKCNKCKMVISVKY